VIWILAAFAVDYSLLLGYNQVAAILARW